MGRHKLPTPILKMRGSRKAKRRTELPQGKFNLTPPADVTADVEALRTWNDYAPGLEANGTLVENNREAFARYCILNARWLAVSRAGEDGVGLADRLLKLECQFGMTPASRSDVKGQHARKDDTTDRYFRKAQ